MGVLKLSLSFEVLGVGGNKTPVLFPGVDVMMDKSRDFSMSGKMGVFCK